jgi:hypothetical protein
MTTRISGLNLLNTELQNLQNALGTCSRGSATSYADMHAIVQRIATYIAEASTLSMDAQNDESIKELIELHVRYVQISYLVAENKTDLAGRTALALPWPPGSSWLTLRGGNPLEVEIMTEMGKILKMCKENTAPGSASSLAPSAPSVEGAK